jgi:hypothetical protein
VSYRYRHIFSAVQRQQTKWPLLALIATFALQMASQIVIRLGPAVGAPVSLAPLLQVATDSFAAVLGGVAIAIAILRHQLFDIDHLINKALVYGSVTGVLATIYFGLVIGAQTAFSNVTGQPGAQPLIVVASTLFIAGLFQPLRGRIQMIIDRRFYRAKYDAQKALAAFNATLRQVVSLTELKERLEGIVTETMQPARVSLWIAPRATEKPDPPNAAANRAESSR